MILKDQRMYCELHEPPIPLKFREFDGHSHAIYECSSCGQAHSEFVFWHNVKLWDKSREELLDRANEVRYQYDLSMATCKYPLNNPEADALWQEYEHLMATIPLVPDRDVAQLRLI